MASTLRFGARAVPLTAGAILGYSAYTLHSNSKDLLRPIRLDDTPFPTPHPAELMAAVHIAPSGVPSTITPLGWGTNEYLTLLPTSDRRTVKNPAPLPQLGATPLRHLVIQEKYGACIDARGDLWMWGTDYDPSGDVGKSLSGRDLSEIAAGPGKVFALSKRGRLYAVSADRSFQEGNVPKRAYWRKLASREPGVDYVELGSNVKLGWGEKWVSISVGANHLLALTNKGRTFSLPLNPTANTHRQLGTRQTFTTPASAEAAVISGPALPPASDPRFETKLTEIPALSGIRIAQIATSDRSSFVRTTDGKVLGFGANDFGQIGLGNRTTVSTIPTPVEIAIGKAYPAGTRISCSNVSAGGATTFFTIEREDGNKTLIDVLSCGNGQNGTLGTGMWSSACYEPAKIKTLSGLQEYSESAQALVPIQVNSVSASPSMNTHAIAVLDTLQSADPQGKKKDMFGKDVLVWGGNLDYQLGTGKRSSIATPTHLPSLIPHAMDTLVAARTEVIDEKPAPEGIKVKPIHYTRLQLHQTKADAYDLQGKLIRRGVRAEETIVPGYNCSVLYNRII